MPERFWAGKVFWHEVLKRSALSPVPSALFLSVPFLVVHGLFVLNDKDLH